MASQITSLTIAYSTVNPDADQRKYQSSASLAASLAQASSDVENVSIWWRHHEEMVAETEGINKASQFLKEIVENTEIYSDKNSVLLFNSIAPEMYDSKSNLRLH